MWSRPVLIAGLLSGAIVAVIALAATWLVIFAAHGGGDPGWTPANSVQVGALGIGAYPLAWRENKRKIPFGSGAVKTWADQ